MRNDWCVVLWPTGCFQNSMRAAERCKRNICLKHLRYSLCWKLRAADRGPAIWLHFSLVWRQHLHWKRSGNVQNSLWHFPSCHTHFCMCSLQIRPSYPSILCSGRVYFQLKMWLNWYLSSAGISCVLLSLLLLFSDCWVTWSSPWRPTRLLAVSNFSGFRVVVFGTWLFSWRFDFLKLWSL